jgi:glycosyltransferase involved in cell wall biosynthesis
MKILVVIITKDYVVPECMRSVIEQDYGNYEWMIFGHHPRHKIDHFVKNLYTNCSETRNGARKLALASDADAFLFMDSDMEIPKNTISNFVKQATNQFGKDRIFGGWYNVRSDPDNRFVAGRWVADNVFSSYRTTLTSLVMTDMVGLGCAFIPRGALEKIEFEVGCDIFYRDEKGRERLVGECLAFGNRAVDNGYSLFMDGDVICIHHEREQTNKEDEQTVEGK